MGYPPGKRRKPRCDSHVYLTTDETVEIACTRHEGHGGFHVHSTPWGTLIRWRLA